MWEYYKEKLKHGSPLDAFYEDAMEFRESAVYAYDVLSRKNPASGAAHDWNAARSAMSTAVDRLDKAFFRFMKAKTAANAEKFSEAWSEMDGPLKMARNAIFASECRKNWLKNRARYAEWDEEDRGNARKA